MTGWEIYDAARGTWSRVEAPAARGGAAVAAVGTKVVLAGGYFDAQYIDRVVIYDTRTGAQSVGHLSRARADAAAVTVGDRILIAGGKRYGKVIDVFNSTTGRWSTARLPAPGWDLTALAVGTKALIAGNRFDGGLRGVVNVFDAVTGRWTTRRIPAAARLTAAAVGGKVGFAGSPNVYDAVADRWSTVPVSAERDFVGVATVGDTMVVAASAYDLIASARPANAPARERMVYAAHKNALAFARTATPPPSPSALPRPSTPLFGARPIADRDDLFA